MLGKRCPHPSSRVCEALQAARARPRTFAVSIHCVLGTRRAAAPACIAAASDCNLVRRPPSMLALLSCRMLQHHRVGRCDSAHAALLLHCTHCSAVCWQAFYSASAFNQNIGSWDVGRVTSLYQLFYSANAFNQEIGGWNVAQLTSFSYVFAGSRFNRDISGWNVASATTLDNMFNSAPAFNQNIASWNVASVADLRYMFCLLYTSPSPRDS